MSSDSITIEFDKIHLPPHSIEYQFACAICNVPCGSCPLSVGASRHSTSAFLGRSEALRSDARLSGTTGQPRFPGEVTALFAPRLIQFTSLISSNSLQQRPTLAFILVTVHRSRPLGHTASLPGFRLKQTGVTIGSDRRGPCLALGGQGAEWGNVTWGVRCPTRPIRRLCS